MHKKLRDVTVHDVTDPLRLGRTAWGEMVREVIRWRELAWRLFVRDLVTVSAELWGICPACRRKKAAAQLDFMWRGGQDY